MQLIEPYAGLAAYSLRAVGLEAQRTDNRRYRLEPPVSRVGSKAGFGPSVLRAWGLSRARWSDVWLNELDPVCHLLHLLYASSELRDAVARRVWAMVPCPVCLPEVIERAFAGLERPTPQSCTGLASDCQVCHGTGVQDARQLWERIRSEPVPGDAVEALAVGLALQTAAFNNIPIVIKNDGVWGMRRETSVSTITFDDRRDGCKPAALAARLESLSCGLASLADVAARALFLQSRSYMLTQVSIVGGSWQEDGYERKRQYAPTLNSPRWTVAERFESLSPGRWKIRGYFPEYPTANNPKMGAHNPRWTVATRLESLPGPGGVSLRITRQDAALCLPEGDCSDCVVILDPPYEGTTGYQATSCRADVLMLARVWHDSGALVILHEACGLAAELGAGWIERPASVLRRRKSLFWAGEEREWITANREPVWWPAQQAEMF